LTASEIPWVITADRGAAGTYLAKS
jgi:hypothetical protein